MRLRIIICHILLLCMPGVLSAQKEYVGKTDKLSVHPRILLPKGEEKELKKQIRKDAIWTDVHMALLEEADSIIQQPLNECVIIGWRLLDVSRDNLRRIFILSYAYRMTGNVRFAKRAEAEMLQAASFPDWNPQHFLDVGEMTMALAIGYDWLYDRLAEKSKEIIATAIIEKGLKPSFNTKYNWFVNAVNNWNQVCHAGVSYGALAIWEKEPELARKVVNRAVEKIRNPMKHYAPDGAYPEGIVYWDYGTSFNALFISAIEKIFGTDYGLSELPGFLESGEYCLQMVTPCLRNFSYSDNGEKAFLMPAVYWFYDKTKDKTLLYNQSRLYPDNGRRQIQKNRLGPAMLIWGASASLAEPRKPEKLFWQAQGDNPVCVMRSSWNESSAAFVGVKLGSPSINHGHMDVGSFVFEANGIPWAIDLGFDDYDRIEKSGIQLWSNAQDAQRWDVFRYNNFAHSTLTFNHKKQRVDGAAHITSYSDTIDSMWVASDLTPVYRDQVKSVKRSVSLVDRQYVVIEDSIETGNRFTKLTWTMVTPASAKVISDHVMLLQKEGKKLYLKVEGPEEIKWNISQAQSDYSYDSPNPGISLIGFDTDLKLAAKQQVRVYLLPDEKDCSK